MSRNVKVNFQGQEHEAESVDINQTSEHWNQYLLEDGTILKLKSVATDVARLVEAYDEEGNPIYVVKSRNILTVVAPEQLKKKQH